METVTPVTVPADRETPEAYFRERARLVRAEGFERAAQMLDNLADSCAQMAAEFEAQPYDDSIPF